MTTTVGFTIDNIFSEIGSSDFLHSFFSTISFHLEPNGWGSRFPEIMNQLYQGKLEASAAPQALKDTHAIKAALEKIPAQKVVWDIDNISVKPPWGDYIDKSVTSLANYHITSTQRVLLDLLIENLEFQVQCNKPLTIETIDQFFKQE